MVCSFLDMEVNKANTMFIEWESAVGKLLELSKEIFWKTQKKLGGSVSNATWYIYKYQMVPCSSLSHATAMSARSDQTSSSYNINLDLSFKRRIESDFHTLPKICNGIWFFQVKCHS